MSNIAEGNFSRTKVAYPLVEKAYAIVNPNKIPFSMAMVGITLPSASYKMSRNTANVMNVFEYVLEGEGRILIDGEWQTVKAGDFYILRQGEEQMYRASTADPWKKIWINYVAGYVTAFCDAYGVKSGVYCADGVKDIFEELIALTRSDMDKQAVSFAIADRVHAIIKAASSNVCDTNDGEYGLKRRISAYVHGRFSLDELAEELHMSKSNVIRIFKREYGVTPYEYLLELKMETAKLLLRDTDLPIKKIADKLCIADEHYFSAMFLKRVGKRPSEYRKEDELSLLGDCNYE